MTAIHMTCRQCGQEHTPSHEDIVRGPGYYRFCPACRPPDREATHCERCGRVLRAGTRTLCYMCLTGGTGL